MWKEKGNNMSVLKKVLILAMPLMLLFNLVSCKSGDNDASSANSGADSNITAKQIIQAMIDKNEDENLDSIAFYDDDLYKENCQKLYSIDYSDIDDGAIAYAGSGGLADEISVIKTHNMSENVVETFLSKRVDRRIQDFTGYKPTEISKIENSKIFSCGGFSVLIISDNASEIQEQIKNIIG